MSSRRRHRPRPWPISCNVPQTPRPRDTHWTATLSSPSSVPESHPCTIANTHKDSAIALRSFLNGISNRMFSTIGIMYKDNNNRVKTLKFTNILSIAASHLHHQKITFEKVKIPLKITFGKVFSTVWPSLSQFDRKYYRHILPFSPQTSEIRFRESQPLPYYKKNPPVNHHLWVYDALQ